jgi:hypothetical protein
MERSQRSHFRTRQEDWAYRYVHYYYYLMPIDYYLPLDTGDAETCSVTVVVFITVSHFFFIDIPSQTYPLRQKNDDPIQFERNLHLGSYAPHADREFCELTGFPRTLFAIYDGFFGDFLPIPTWSRYDICGETPVIIRPLDFEDEDCRGLEGLLTQLEDQTYDKKTSSSSKGKEKAVCYSRSAELKRKKKVDCGEGGSDLKRRKYEVIIELTGGESKEVLVIDDSD